MKEIEVAIVRWHKDNEASRRLATIPGVGPITASAIVATITDPFSSAPLGTLRPGSGWCPDSTAAAANSAKGGFPNRAIATCADYSCWVLTAVIRHSRSKPTAEAGWLKSLLERGPARLVSVAQANKMARIVWALLVRGETYRMPAAVRGGAA